MVLYARNDAGVIRCAECDARFGVVRHGHALIDVGWKVVERDMPRFSDRVITIQEHNLPRFHQAVGRGNLPYWKAKRKTDKRRGDNKRGRASHHLFVVVDSFGTPWIACPKHGLQLIDHGVLGTTEWFEHQLDLGPDVWVFLPSDDATESDA